MKVSVLTAAPAVEPITLAQAKRQVRIDQGNTTYDTELTEMITSARQWVENRYRISIITQTLVQKQDNFYESLYRYPLDGLSTYQYCYTRFPIKLLNNPVQSITSLKYIDPNGVQQTLVLDTDYGVSGKTVPVVGGPRSIDICSIYPINNWPLFKWIPQPIEITYVAGFGADATYVPGPVKTAILRVLTMLFDNRLDEGMSGDRIQYKMAHDIDMVMSSFQTFDNANIYA